MLCFCGLSLSLIKKDSVREKFNAKRKHQIPSFTQEQLSLSSLSLLSPFCQLHFLYLYLKIKISLSKIRVRYQKTKYPTSNEMMKEKIEGGEKENKIYILINNNIGPVFVKNTTSPINLTVTKSAKKKNVKVKISYGTEGWDHRWEKNEIVLYFLFIYLLKRERERKREFMENRVLLDVLSVCEDFWKMLSGQREQSALLFVSFFLLLLFTFHFFFF